MDRQAKFAPINRNLLHFPLARDQRAPLNRRRRVRLEREPYEIIVLHRGRPPKTRSGEPKGKAKVWLTVPSGLEAVHPELVRAPTRYDIDILIRLVAMAVMGKNQIVHKWAFAQGGRAIAKASKKRGQKKLFHKHRSDDQDVEMATFELGVKKRGYMGALSDASGRPNPNAEKAAGRAAYRSATERLRRTISGSPTLVFSSKRQLLNALGRATNKSSNYRSLENSLEFLRSVELGYSAWHAGKGANDRRNDERKFRLIDEIVYARNGAVRIYLNEDFLSTTTSYFAKVPLPLPLKSEAAQNLELWLHVFKLFELEYKVRRRFEDFCKTLGITADSDSKASRSLDSALAQVNEHRSKRGEDVSIEFEPSQYDDEIVRFKLKRQAPPLEDD